MLCTLIVSTPAQIVKADVGPPPNPTVGGVMPYQPQKTNVQMMSETVLIDVPQSPSNVQEAKQIKVTASFTMRNQGQAEEQMQVIFPLTYLNTEWFIDMADYSIDMSSFAAKVNGQSVPFTTITTPPEMTISDSPVEHEHGFNPEVQWAAFEVTFPVQQDVILQVEYEMLNPNEYSGFTGIAYILETGAGWYGHILCAEIALNLPYPITEEAVRANPGYVISGNEMHWTFKDFEPTREDNLRIWAINADTWQSILKLRATVEKHPEDAEAWSELGDQYMGLGIIMGGASSRSDPRFIELTIEARQKVVELQPDSGEAHYKLAEILWLSNPYIQHQLMHWQNIEEPVPSLEDPIIQQAMQELQLARSLGIQDDLPYLDYVFPEVALTLEASSTVTIVPPIVTLAPIETSNVLPTIPSTLSPMVSATPTPSSTKTSSYANNILFGVVLGVLIAGGAFIYQMRSKLGSTK